MEQATGSDIKSGLAVHLFSFFIYICCSGCFFLEQSELFFDANKHYLSFLLIFGWLLFILLLILINIYNYKFLPSAFYTVFYWVSMLVSATMIECGAYMLEIGFNGTPNGTFWITLLFSTIALQFQFFGFHIFRRRTDAMQDLFNKEAKYLANAILLTVISASFVIVYIYGTPSSSGVNRVLYWGSVAPSYLSPIRIAVTTSVFIAGYIALKSKSIYIIIFFFLIYLYLGYGFLGEKFSIFIQYSFFIGAIFAAMLSKKDLKKAYILGILLFAGLIIGVIRIYVNSGVRADFIFDRITLQGQLLWSVLREDTYILWEGFLNQCNPDCAKLFDPRDLASQRYVIWSLYQARKATGTTLTGYVPAIPILYFGIPTSILLQAAIGFLLGLLQSRLIYAIENNTLMYSFFLAIIYYLSTSLWYVFNQNLIIPLFIMIFFTYIYRITFIRYRYGRGLSPSKDVSLLES